MDFPIFFWVGVGNVWEKWFECGNANGVGV